MLLIPGLLRCIDDNLLRFLDSASDYAEIFIVTDKSFSQEVALLVDRYNAKSWYAEDLADKYQLNTSYFPGAFNQWLKFNYALNQALEWEEANGTKFEFIHRIRTDVTYPNKFHELMVLPIKNKSNDNICMLNHNDFCFSSGRNALPFLLNLASFFQDFTRDDVKLANILKFVNIDQLKQSEKRSAFYVEAFPIGILSGNQTPDEFGLLLKKKYPSFIEAAVAFAISLSDPQYMRLVLSLVRKSPNLIKTWDCTKCYFPYGNEELLMRFYNFFGIYTYTYPYGSMIMLKLSRQATTEFTSNIMQMIENNDFSFLSDDEINWDKEINIFFEKGGNLSKLFEIFTRSAYHCCSKLKKNDRNKLETIFELFFQKCTFNINFIIDEKFKSFASEIDLKLPSTDFYEFARSALDLVALKRFDEAQAKVEEGLNKMPYQMYLLRIANDVYRASENREKSLEYANSLILHHPSDCLGYTKSAQDLVALKRFDEAQAIIKEGLDRMPNQLNLLHNANDVYRASGNREKSLEYANRLIIHHPNDWNGYTRSAQDLAALKRFDEAQAKVQEGLSKIPNQINLLHIANDVYRASGNREKSLEYAESLILHHPNDWSGYARSAQDLAALKRFDEARVKVEEGLSKIPNQISLLHIANDVYRASGNREKSLEYANRLIIHHPNDWNGYTRSAQDLVALKRFDEAQAKVQEGLSKIPNHTNLLQISSDIDQALGKPG